MSAEDDLALGAGFRRFLLDLHIADDSTEYLSRFDPARFARLVKETGAVTVTVPANNHVGLDFWPSATGWIHGQMTSDLLGDMLSAARARGLTTVVYYCLLYVEKYWLEHPESRIVDADGNARRAELPTTHGAPRFCLVCPNNPGYREFAAGQLSELARNYDFDFVNLDMTFWGGVCYCASCSGKFMAEEGESIPTIVDWRDPNWLSFARARRRWMREFTREMTDAVRNTGHRAAIYHQSQGYTQDWLLGIDPEMAREGAWLSADLYRTRRELAFAFKLFNQLSPAHPFEQISCWSFPDVFEHNVMRTEAELTATGYLPLANNAALTIIEVPDPDGSLTEDMYPVAKRVFDKMRPLEEFVGGRVVADVAVYLSFSSSVDLTTIGEETRDLGYAFEPSQRVPSPSAHRPAAMNAAESLSRAHVPFAVATRNDLTRLSEWKVLVVPNASILSAEEREAFRTFVNQGGALYASGDTSLIDEVAGTTGDFWLGDLFGVSRRGDSSGPLSYMSPHGSDGLLGVFHSRRPMTIHSPQTIVETADPKAVVHARFTPAMSDPRGSEYAIVIDDPPGLPSEHPAIVEREFGHGRVLYASAAVEAELHVSQRSVFVGLVRRLLRDGLSVEVAAPECVDVTTYDQGSRLVVNLLNIQEDAPAVPVHDIRVTLRTGARTVTAVRVVGGEELHWTSAESSISFVVPTCYDLTLVVIDLDLDPGEG